MKKWILGFVAVVVLWHWLFVGPAHIQRNDHSVAVCKEDGGSPYVHGNPYFGDSEVICFGRKR